MKNFVVLAAVLLMGSLASAQANFDHGSYDTPTESGWAIGMIESACGINLGNNVVGTITKAKGGVVYRAYNANGEVVAAAKAKSTFIFAKKTCLN